MGAVRTIGAVAVVAGSPTPVYHGPIIVAQSFSILNGIATVVLGFGNLPPNGYNGPNGFPVPNIGNNSQFDIHGGISGQNNTGGANSGGGPAGGQQVVLWGFTTATYFNGKKISVIDCNPVNGSFRFYFNHANVASTADTGNTAASPFQHFRAVRLECSQSNTTDFVYVGDLNVSATQYMAALSLAGQLSVVIASENIPADGIFIDGTHTGDSVQVSLIY